MAARRLIWFNMVTLDGLFEGPGHNIDWHRVDEEFNEFAIDQLKTGDALVFGRITYELMASYWPTPEARADDQEVAGLMNSLPKIIASRTLTVVDWENARLVGEDITQEIAALKEQPGKNLLLFGSADLAVTLMHAGLIDEIRVIVAPIVLGAGTPLFKQVTKPFELKLVNSRVFRNGNVLLCYEPVREGGST